MVKTLSTKRYVCSICKTEYFDLETAKYCEDRKPKKIYIINYDDTSYRYYNDSWNIGDLVFYNKVNESNKLCMGEIIKEEIHEHDIIPIIKGFTNGIIKGKPTNNINKVNQKELKLFIKYIEKARTHLVVESI